ncbi:NACHT domain-containing protein [Mycobacterium sp. NPDC051804]|uniref:NACHT domain-containing protein n=1 Tax=Mycobacterium sp. NPDC051804 TaxID=3364295 RepID=UPI00378EAE99
METDFEYEQLSPAAFEQLGVALVESVIGSGIEVYGPGRDGGREATYDGLIRWSATDAGDRDSWDGYTVVQVKQCQNPSDPAANLSWLSGQLRDEFDRWMKPDSQREGRFPDYLLVITNVRLSAADPGGGIDTLRGEIEKRLAHEYKSAEAGRPPVTLRSRGLRQVRVWHRDKINVLVTNSVDARRRFSALLTSGDVLARLDQIGRLLPGLIPEDLIAGLFVDHAQTTLAGDRWIRFDEAGDEFNSQSIEKVIYDLPAITSDGVRQSALKAVFDRGDEVLSRSIWATTRDDPPRHIVVTGAPGNGKSTLTRYLTQVYRGAFARYEANETAIIDLIDSTDESLERLPLDGPSTPRWPLRIELARMAELMGPNDGGPNLRRYLCDEINLDSSVPVHTGTLDNWLKAWPCVILLDGLDEVTHPALRHRVQHEISALIEKADAMDADLLLVVTTRPTGYTPLLPEHFEQIDLDYFTREEAREYGRHVTTHRLASNPGFLRTALARFDAAAEGAAVERLLTTPLQVLILTIIAARSGPLPANRYELFWSYYDTVFKREAAKPTTYLDFFNRYAAEITAIHQRVGFVLHCLCEATQELRGRLSVKELRAIARDRMLQLGHGIPAANELADQMAVIATQRLVLLTSDEDEMVSFDVRSLQELMAGCALVDVSEAVQRNNLVATACSPHWRNAWLFAAGRLFTGSDYQRDLVLAVVEQCDTLGHWHGWLYPAAPELAADILDDGLAADKPTARRRLIDVALRAINGPMLSDPKSLALHLSVAVSTTETSVLAASGIGEDRRHVRSVLQDAFTNSDPGHARYVIAAVLLEYGYFGSRIPGQPEDLKQFTDAWSYAEPVGQRVNAASLMLGALENYDPSSYPPSTTVFDAVNDLRHVEMVRSERGNLRLAGGAGRSSSFTHFRAALDDPDAEQELQIVFEAVPDNDWAMVSVVAQAYWPIASRWPVSARLHVPGDPMPAT